MDYFNFMWFFFFVNIYKYLNKFEYFLFFNFIICMVLICGWCVGNCGGKMCLYNLYLFYLCGVSKYK